MRRVAAMNVCSCGWTIVSPQGPEDVRKHTVIHLKDVHPGSVMTPEEIMAHIKQL
jgi:predicted small metal-binding protein